MQKAFSKTASVDQAEKFLEDLKFPPEFRNDRCALTLLVLADLKPGDPWSLASAPMLTIHQIMGMMSANWKKNYKENSRETIRRFTLHQFIEAGLITQNKDEPNRPTNSPKWNYSLLEETVQLMRLIGDESYEAELTSFNQNRETWKEKTEDPRHLIKLPVGLPAGRKLELSPGGQNDLIKKIIEDFCPRFLQKPRILFVGDSSKAHEIVDAELLAKLNLTLPRHGKEPDVIVFDEDRKWIFLIEACSSHGPIDVLRKKELLNLFGVRNDVVYVSCFPNRKIMQKYLSSLAWETECWCADSLDHMIHLDGAKFLGPYN